VTFVLFLAVAANAAAGAVEPQPEGVRPQAVTGLQAVDLFDIAFRAQRDGNIVIAEKAYGALSNDPDIEVRTEARFRHAMLLAEGKHWTQAAVLLRQILDEKPKAGRVRIELARMMVQMGEWRSAGRELRAAQAAGLPKEIALVVDQFALALRSKRPFGGSLEIAFAPDTNINRATRSETIDTIIAPFELSDDARAKSGVGFQVGAQAFARQSITDWLDVQARLSSRSSLYKEKEFNDVLAGGEVGVELRLGRNRISPSIGHNRRWYGGKAYSSTDTASLNWQRQLGRAGLAELEVSTGRANYQRNDLQDGWVHEASLAYERSLTATFGGRITLNGQRQTARDPAYATKSGGATLLAWKQIGRMSLFGTAGLRRLEADERVFLYPERRREWLTSLSAGATFRQLTWSGFAPLVRVSWERNKSSLTLYDYDRVSTTFGITRAF